MKKHFELTAGSLMAIIAVLTVILWGIWMVCWQVSLGDTPPIPEDDIAREETLRIIFLFAALFGEGILYLCLRYLLYYEHTIIANIFYWILFLIPVFIFMMVLAFV